MEFYQSNGDRASSFKERTSSIKERTSSFKQKLLEGTGSRKNSELMSEFSTSIRFASEERLKEIAEQKQIRYFTKRLKCYAYFFLIFAVFILLNACIGFSSAPFYLPDVSCNKIEPSEGCQYLQTLTSVLYFIELFGSLLLVIHGLLAIALVDHIKNLTLIRFLIKFTKFCFVLYIVLIVLRVGVYLKVHYEVLQVDMYDKDQGFGNFLASYIVENKIAAICITSLLMSVFLLCFICNCLTLKIVRRVEKFVLNPHEGEVATANNFGINSRNSVMSSNSDEKEESETKSSSWLCFKRNRQVKQQQEDEDDSHDQSQSSLIKKN